MAGTGYKKYKDSSSGQKRILYDARGVRVKSSIFTNKYIRFILLRLVPYLVINGIILFLVCATPSVSITVSDTDDYVTSNVSFTVKSVLPIKSMEVSLESENLEYEKSGSGYSTVVNGNGTFMVRATAINGMQKTVFEDIAMLDDTAPTVDETTTAISQGRLTFTIYDSQSGVDYDSIYATVDGSEVIYPSEIDKDLGLVSFDLPQSVSTIDLNYADMVGNARSSSISVTVYTEDDGEDEEAEETAEEDE